MNAMHILRAPARALLMCLAAFDASAQLALAQTAPRSDDKLQCATEAEIAQRLRSSGRLVEAGTRLSICARPACPAAIRADCSLWQREVVRATASILVHARDAEGVEVRDVTLVVDEKRAVQSDGTQPVDLDPGEHVIEFSHPGAFPVTETVRVEAGQKNRLVAIQFKRVPEATSPVRPDPVSPAAPRPSSNGPNVLAWTATGLTVAAVGTFAYFGTTGKSELDLLKESCPSGCDQSSIDSAWKKLIIADLSLGVAFASACAATYFFLADSDKGERPPQRTVVRPSVAPSARGVTIYWTGQF